MYSACLFFIEKPQNQKARIFRQNYIVILQKKELQKIIFPGVLLICYKLIRLQLEPLILLKQYLLIHQKIKIISQLIESFLLRHQMFFKSINLFRFRKMSSFFSSPIITPHKGLPIQTFPINFWRSQIYFFCLTDCHY